MKRVILFLLIFVVFSFANRIIAKDSTPGGIYIIGPDVSPDSSSHTILYYSPDGGYTLEIRDTLDWIDWLDCVKLAVDVTPNNVYINSHYWLYGSIDGGRTWDARCSEIYLSCDNIKSGVLPGLITLTFRYSFDYGYTWPLLGCGSAYFGSPSIEHECDCDGIHTYVENSTGVLFIRDSLPGTLTVAIDLLEPHSIFRGSIDGEMYAFKYPNILFSDNYLTSIDTVGSIEYLVPDSFEYELISGWESGELFCVATKYNVDYYYDTLGGEIIVWRSSDYGANWELVRHYQAIIAECPSEKEFNISISPNPFTNIINTNVPVRILDISGREIACGKGRINLEKLSPGLYFAQCQISNNTYTKKILKVQ